MTLALLQSTSYGGFVSTGMHCCFRSIHLGFCLLKVVHLLPVVTIQQGMQQTNMAMFPAALLWNLLAHVEPDTGLGGLNITWVFVFNHMPYSGTPI